jgi:hypothetical protein
MPGRVRPDQSENGRRQQEDAADALNMDELLNGKDKCSRDKGLAQFDLKRSVCARRNAHGENRRRSGPSLHSNCNCNGRQPVPGLKYAGSAIKKRFTTEARKTTKILSRIFMPRFKNFRVFRPSVVNKPLHTDSGFAVGTIRERWDILKHSYEGCRS